MNDFFVGYCLAMATVLIFGACVYLLLRRHLDRRDQRAIFTVQSSSPVHKAIEPAEEEVEQARPIDMENPPYYRTYRPPTDKPGPFCVCHGTAIKPGETVLLWPVPGSDGRVDVFHKNALRIGDST